MVKRPLQEVVIVRLVQARGGDPSSLIDVLRLGGRAGVVSAWIIQWAQTRNRLGRLPTVVEYATEWNVSERTGWVHKAGIVECFPGDLFAVAIEDVALSIHSMRKPRVGSVLVTA